MRQPRPRPSSPAAWQGRPPPAAQAAAHIAPAPGPLPAEPALEASPASPADTVVAEESQPATPPNPCLPLAVVADTSPSPSPSRRPADRAGDSAEPPAKRMPVRLPPGTAPSVLGACGAAPGPAWPKRPSTGPLPSGPGGAASSPGPLLPLLASPGPSAAATPAGPDPVAPALVPVDALKTEGYPGGVRPDALGSWQSVSSLPLGAINFEAAALAAVGGEFDEAAGVSPLNTSEWVKPADARALVQSRAADAAPLWPAEGGHRGP